MVHLAGQGERQAEDNTSQGKPRGTRRALPLGMLPPTPPAHPAFGTAPTYYLPPTTLIRRPDDMLSSPLGQPILDYEPPRWFVILAFTTFDGATGPYENMLYYNQAIILNTGNSWLLCKVFPSSLWGQRRLSFTSSHATQ